MPRQLFPALRGLLVPRATAEPLSSPTETKDLLAGGVYTSVTLAGVTNVWGTPGRADGWDLERVIVEGYERSIWTFKSVEAISKHASTLPIQIGRGGDERRFEEVLEEHPLLRLLNKQANPLETGDVFKKRLSAQLLLSMKGVFIEKTYSRGGVLTRLDLLPPDRVQMILDDENASYIKHFEFTDYAGHIRELKPKYVIWLRDPHPTDPFCGVTPLEAAGLSVDLDVKARTYNISFIDNDGRPGGIVGIDLDGVDSAEVDRIQKRLAPGAHNAGQLTLVGTSPGGVTYVDTSARPREMAYETLSSTAKNVAIARSRRTSARSSSAVPWPRRKSTRALAASITCTWAAGAWSVRLRCIRMSPTSTMIRDPARRALPARGTGRAWLAADGGDGD